ncbi:MAG TPA: hypothetical protein DDY31_19835 [Lachnospiraceae bacterium]|nr:hypothetical protein [Lachnospiraceae bacterium]
MRKNLISAVCLACILCSACSSQETADFSVPRQPYEKDIYNTDTARRGNLEPEITLTLKTDGYKRICYDSLEENLELEKVYVSVGDHVKKGDILVSFQCRDIQKAIMDYKEKITENRLLTSHYEKLMKINPQISYREDMESLEKDRKVAKLYLKEYENKLENYQIKAKRDGTIIYVNERLAEGIYEPGRALITQAGGSGKYEAEKPENYTFHKGELYHAMQDTVSYPMRVEKITEKSIIFKPGADMDEVSEDDILTIIIPLEKLKNVVYVPAAAVRHEEDYKEQDIYYVYTVDENGYRSAVKIKPGGKVGEYMVIEKGLQGGETICI